MKTDVVIVGGGPGGSACAMFLLKAGIRPVIVEKATFPRYHVGESMTGECGACVRALGLEEEMMALGHPVKHGVRVYGPRGREPWYVPVMGRDEKGELFPAYTWQVRRSVFDDMMLKAAVARGAELIRGEAIAALGDAAEVRGVRVRRPDGSVEDIEAAVVVDATGLSTFLSNAGVLGKKERGRYDKQVAIFSQVENAVLDPGRDAGDTIILYQKKHHWAWFIPIDEKSVSVGIVVPSAYFQERNESKHDFFVRELGELNPELARRVPDRTPVEEVRAVSNYSFEIRDFAGKGYLCVGDSHRFIDPVFSFGLYFSLKEAEAAAGAIAGYLRGAGAEDADPFAAYQAWCTKGLDVIQEVIDAFWNQPLAFAVFVHSRHVEDCIDMFAGRVYMDEPSAGLLDMRKVNALPAHDTAVAAGPG